MASAVQLQVESLSYATVCGGRLGRQVYKASNVRGDIALHD